MRCGLVREAMVWLSLLALAAGAAGCGEDAWEPLAAPAGKADGVTVDPDLSARIGTVFLREQFIADTYSSVARTIRDEPPGGILFWNGSSAADRRDAAQLRRTIVAYSRAARDAGHPPLLFSADYEGGALRYSSDGRQVSGVQRFTDGFTALAHPRWLGAAYRFDHALGRELAQLHGQLMAQELASVGINYPLSVISDLAQRLFAVRGIDTDEQIVAELMRRVLDGFLAQPDAVFVTKHFPGLGQTRGDTHDAMVTAQTGIAELERHLVPFRAVLEHARQLGAEKRLSVMCGHASFPSLDPAHNTTVSPRILGGLLRGAGDTTTLPVAPLGLRGIALSDAMWMGPYGEMGWSELRRIYLQSLVAGMDMLMIPGANYAKAVDYFRQVYEGRIAAAEQGALEQLLGSPWPQIRADVARRLAESIARIDDVRWSLRRAVELVDADGVRPTQRTSALRARYHEILTTIDARWRSWL